MSFILKLSLIFSISKYFLGMITKEDISNVSGEYNRAFFPYFHKYIADGILSEFRDRKKVKIAKSRINSPCVR